MKFDFIKPNAIMLAVVKRGLSLIIGKYAFVFIIVEEVPHNVDSIESEWPDVENHNMH